MSSIKISYGVSSYSVGEWWKLIFFSLTPRRSSSTTCIQNLACKANIRHEFIYVVNNKREKLKLRKNWKMWKKNYFRCRNRATEISMQQKSKTKLKSLIKRKLISSLFSHSLAKLKSYAAWETESFFVLVGWNMTKSCKFPLFGQRHKVTAYPHGVITKKLAWNAPQQQNIFPQRAVACRAYNVSVNRGSLNGTSRAFHLCSKREASWTDTKRGKLSRIIL